MHYLQEESESMDHLFLWCKDTYLVWYKIYHWLNISAVIYKEFRNQFLLILFRFVWVVKKRDQLWSVYEYVLFGWCGKEEIMQTLKALISHWISWWMKLKTQFWSWMSTSSPNICNFSFESCLHEPRLILNC